MQKSDQVDDDIHISALDVFYEMDGRKSLYIEELLDCYREEDAGCVRRNELNELVENMTLLNALEEKCGKVGIRGKVRKVTRQCDE